MPTPRERDRANHSAIGTPSTMQMTMLMDAVRRLSPSAASADGDVISGMNSAQFTRLAIAITGITMKAMPSAAAPITHFDVMAITVPRTRRPREQHHPAVRG